MAACIDCLTSIPLHTPTKLLREATIENEFLGFDDAYERMQPHLQNQVCVNNFCISKLTSFAMHMMTQEISAVSLNYEGLFQLWFDYWWCIRWVTHIRPNCFRIDCLTSIPLHTPKKFLREAIIENEFLGFDDACREDAAASSKSSMCQYLFYFEAYVFCNAYDDARKKCCEFNFWGFVSALVWLLMVYTTGNSQTVFA